MEWMCKKQISTLSLLRKDFFSLMHPLDLIKTRFQIQRGAEDPTRYTSLYDCFKKISKSEGLLGFYKGILPPILAETPKRATKFFTFERYKNLFSIGQHLSQPVQQSTISTAREILKKDGFGNKGLNKGLTSTLGRHGVFNMIYFSFYHNIKNILPEKEDKTVDFLQRFTIGFLSGVIGSCTNIPFDVAKSRIQGPQPEAGVIKYKTCFQTIKLIYKEEGYLALYKGLVPKVLRLGPGAAIMMIVYENVFQWLKEKI
ncbi:SLC25A21 [Acanthosepion pharaonis]|uniref:Mitochondrial 2-oxodicarboxylate carrier n=1 Tax=Acanthosepion pharaonis TaxID=158019 RepID=A0A812DF10_ACAPH|nr:SLC25A21 [Sepia pharaonis]